ncbi:hypothetical protein C4D60_Mb11t09880 [Musa balbisiana]|uniref:Uncharacterized protein n=1 Tax=Musa balbisiana TaxID=52838 RepID=A0A4S8J303_MUSBA|nr:hypothetical protein C4D60_Mb11t09880 [Musa balbisiana]
MVPTLAALLVMVYRPLLFNLDLDESLEPHMDDPADEPLYVPDDPLDSIRFLFDPLGRIHRCFLETRSDRVLRRRSSRDAPS